MIKKNKKILVTCALPYANGPIHIGHLLEHIQADIWVRFHRMNKKIVFFICADDSHGTAIMLKSKSMNICPKDLIKIVFKKHLKDLLNFNISYDNYSHTHSKENLYYSQKIFLILKKRGFIKKKKIYQLYDSLEKIFLPDRLVKGICPKCFNIDQYGDHCESCGSVYNAKDLISPKSQISGSIPILKNSTHFFLNLPNFEKKLKLWISSGILNKNVENKTKEWFKKGLKLWDISRDSPYFGFNIPGYKDKYFYVWLDAPICYISTFKNLCLKNKKINFQEFWKSSKNTDLYHFIGKDIIYFHSIFWPSILEGINFRKPTKIFVHGHVTLNKKKMSKSKNKLIKASTWLKFFDSDSLRYYFASKLSASMKDIEFDLKEFVHKINSDIVNKIVNLASRCSSFINNYFNSMLSDKLLDLNLYNVFLKKNKKIFKLFKSRKYSSIIYIIVKYAEKSNYYINDAKPWNLFKNNKYNIQIQLICTMGINLFRFLITWLKPIMPDLSNRVEQFLNIKLSWKNLNFPLLNHKISKFNHLYNRLNHCSSKIFYK
ncbi:methionine--tRNA ligase [Buchnera aphidicola]|uniref:methionine--tRNA ligase n=1 Tax=Buchnera aphidicola TaxID=9 RepID=UPI002238EC3C|nr:methionine--tRNA ligase [Buchnera aphidicola]MCW5197619.1 methionine--tRNA ligase [Buchnera aphidicola (Chaitophorus viminalis)]